MMRSLRACVLALVPLLVAAPQVSWGMPLELPAGVQTPEQRITRIGTRVEDMAPETRHAYILGIQEELAAHGYHVGPIDGDLGSKTKGAIRQYQRDASLPVDGVASKELLDHLKFARPKVYARTAKTPDDSVLVRDIQLELQQRGYYQGPIDGLTGPSTREAVSQFQLDAGLPVTGRVGNGVLSDLRSADPSVRRY